MTEKYAVIAMSGGVDSSVAALLSLRKSAECIGVTLKLFNGESGCCSLSDVEDARAVCQRLGIPHYTLNYKDAFQAQIIEHFVESYENGFTPNPCIECNRHMKFDKLLLEAETLGYSKVVTGHYARITQIGGNFYLQKAIDAAKDQSYVLYMLSDLSKVEFPLGILTKSQVREIAAENGFVNAAKKDSQDICFVPNGKYAEFIEHYTGKIYPPGKFVDVNGKILGDNRGTMHYTIGQRRGLGVSHSEPLYVKSKTGNTITLAPDRELYSKTLYATDVNVLVPDKLTHSVKLTARTRYRQTEQPCTAEFIDENTLRADFTEPQRAITPGQAVVFYDGDTVVAGGRIQL